jgi:hypothetical protein
MTTSHRISATTRWSVIRDAGQVRVHYHGPHGPAQYAALHVRDSYFRLNAGPRCGWGTSVILLPVYWSEGRCHHGGRVTASWQQEDSRLVLSLQGEVGGLRARLSVSLAPPADGRMVADVQARVEGDVRLDNRPGERFKPVMLSSMYASPTLWDAQAAQVGDVRHPLPLQGWVVPPDEVTASRTFGLLGGTCAWKTHAPTIDITLDRALPITGWVTRSDDPNDDSVGFWAAADHVLRAYSYRITAALP